MLKDFGVTRLSYLQSFTAKDVTAALAIEKHFCDLGMERCNSQKFHKDNSTTVYTYLLPTSIRPKK
jgi:hypothetical protein